MDIITLLWIFLIYSFIGWCVEVVYNTAISGKFVNRGFLSSPVCPIYGTGILLLLLTTVPFQDNIFLLFGAVVLITSLLELLVGLALKLIFKQTWWDYSRLPFNLGGFICLKFSLIWGLGGIIILKIIHPMIAGLVEKIASSQIWSMVLAIILAGLLIDLIATVNRILKIRKHLILIDDIDQQIQQLSQEIGLRLHEASKKTLEELERRRHERDESLGRLKRRARRLVKSFPDSNLAAWLSDHDQDPGGSSIPRNKR